MSRRLTIKGAQKKLTKLTREFVLERDNNRCQKCGKFVKGNAHLSHIIPKARGNRLRWEPKNLLIKCFRCHNWWHNNPTESEKWFKKKFPQRWAYLQEHQHDTVKWTVEDYKTKIEQML